MAKFRRKFVTTKRVLEWDGQRYVEVERDGYWYDGPWALATHDREPTWVIESYRWRNDDGTESTATWAQTQDTALTTGVGAGTNIRLRMSFGETNDATVNNTGSWTLQYRVDTGGGFGSWTDVGSTGAVHTFDSTNLTNNTGISTERLTNATLSAAATFTSGFGDENEDGVTPSQTWNDEYGEAEFSLEFDSGQSSGDVFEFRLTSPQSTNPTPENTPSITLAGVTTTLTADGGALTATGGTAVPTLLVGANGSAITLTPGTASLTEIIRLTADSSAITLTGGTADLRETINLTADGGAVSLTPAIATFTELLAANTAALTLTPAEATLSEALLMPAVGAALTLTPATATTDITLGASSQAITLASGTADFVESTILTANSTPLTLTGGTATATIAAASNPAAITLTGGTTDHTVTLGATSAALTLSPASGVFVEAMQAVSTALSLTGGVATLSDGGDVTLDAQPGTLALTAATALMMTNVGPSGTGEQRRAWRNTFRSTFT